MSLSTDHYQRLIRIGNELLSADRDVEQMRRDCTRQAVASGLSDKDINELVGNAVQFHRRLLCQTVRDRLSGDSLDIDDLALLRCMQEIAFVRDEATSSDHWSELSGHFDDVVSGVDHAIAAEMSLQAEAA
jgi:hypothetical protein